MASTDECVKVVGEVIQSPSDSRHYRSLVLSNALRVLLISDPETDKCGAAVDVNVGHYSDPKEPTYISGLAHYLEHMLFLGTQKYPVDREYHEFLSKNGGHSNAYTAQEHTCYYFDVSHTHLFEALDRFAHFFIDPLFNEDAAEREMNAVDSENSKNLQTDQWRVMQLLRSSANPEHPMSNFGTGNLTTLQQVPQEAGLNIREVLLDFHQSYYSANMMTLAVLGRESLDELQARVVPLFNQVRNTDRLVPSWDVPVFTPSQLGFIRRVVPICELREVTIVWPIPPQSPLYRKKPTKYIAHLLGHESGGSILSLLKARGWASGLTAGSGESTSCGALMQVGVELTPSGLEHVMEVVAVVYQYVRLLQSTPPEKWIFDELQSMCEARFRFLDKAKAFRYLPAVASAQQKYPQEESLCGGYLMHEWDPSVIEDMLALMTPQNGNVLIVSNSFAGQTDKVEKWYQTDYSEQQLTAEELELFSKDVVDVGVLHLPERNPFIPENFDIKGAANPLQQVPALVHQSDWSRLWHLQDTTFALPKAITALQIDSPVAYGNPLASMMTNLWTKLVSDALNEWTYYAEVAGLTFYLDNSVTGLTITISGYNDKQPRLLAKLAESIAHFEPSRERFESVAEKFCRDIRNWSQGQPYQHVMYHRQLLTESPRWSMYQYQEVLDQLTLESVTAHGHALMKRVCYEVLCIGNVTKEDVFVLRDTVDTALKPSIIFDGEIHHKRIVCVDTTDCVRTVKDVHNKEDKNSAVENYYQVGEDTSRSRAVLSLFAQLVEPLAFDQLRTQEQLGYIVFSGRMAESGVQGWICLVQSSVASASWLDVRIEAWIASLEAHLEALTPDVIEENKASLRVKLLEKDQSLADVYGRFMPEIKNHLYRFDARERVVLALESITAADVLAFYRRYIGPNAPKRRKVSSWLQSAVACERDVPSDDDTREWIDADVFHPEQYRRTRPLYRNRLVLTPKL